MSKPNVTMTLEPFEDNLLVYLAAVPFSAGATPRHRLHFKLSIKNNGSTTETLQKITVGIFPNPVNSTGAEFVSFSRNIAIGPNNTGTTQIAWNEEIPVPDIPLVKYEIHLQFLNHDELASMGGFARPHVSPTPQGSYRFFGNTDDMGIHEYFVPDRHEDPGQFYEYDMKVKRWISAENNFRLTKPGTTGKKNEDYFGYGKPLYAMADGVVINAINNIEENPAPEKRALMRVGENEAGLVSAFKLVRLSTKRMATAVRTATGTLKIIIWELQTPGVDVGNSQLIRLGDIEAEETISNVDAFTLNNDKSDSSSMLVTALRLTSGVLKVIVWEVSADGMSLTRLGEDEAEVISQLAADNLSATSLTVAVITATGNLKVIVWDVGDGGLTLSRRGDAEAGGISRLDAVALGKTRLLTAVRTETNALKLILWNILPNETLVPSNDITVPGPISDLSVAWIRSPNSLSDVRVTTAIRGSGNQLQIKYWKITDNNQFVLLGELDGGNAQAVKLSHVTSKDKDDTAVCSITPDGNLQVTMWRLEPGTNSIWAEQNDWIPYSQNGGGPTDLIDIIWLKDDTPYYFVTAVRTAQKTLKLITWFLASGAGNYLLTLHGDEVISMDHMMSGSLNPALLEPGVAVKQGQFVGRLGNSGNSGAPHMHLEASQIDQSKSVEDLIADKQKNALSQVYRPIPFHNAQARLLAELEAELKLDPGLSNTHSFSKVDGNGFYWDAMAVWPGLTTPGIPTGQCISAVSWGPDRLDIFLRGSESGTVFHKAWDGSQWLPSETGWQNLGGGITGSPAAVSWGPNRLDVFVRGSQSGAVFHKAWDGAQWIPSETGWQNLGGGIIGPPAAVSWGPNRLDVFVTGLSGAVFHKAWNGAWLPSELGWQSLGGDISGSPVAVSWGPNRLDIFARGLGSGAVFHKAWDGAWQPSELSWQNIGGGILEPPSAVSWGSERLDIFVRGSESGAAFHKAWDGSWIPSQLEWQNLGGGIIGPPAAVSWGPNRLDIFVTGQSGHIFHKAWDGSQWQPSQAGWQNLGGIFIGPPTAVSWGPGRLDIFGLGLSGAVFHKAWNGSWLPSQTGWQNLGGEVG